MAIYHLSMKALQRSKGRSAVSAAAYRAAEKIEDTRTGFEFDYTRKSQVDHKELIGWSGSRSDLWQSVEAHHKRGDATPAREVEVSLPVELSDDSKIKLAQKFSTEISEKYGVAVDLCIHKIDSDNPHAHILFTSCSVDVDGKLGKKVEALDPISCSRTKPPTPNPADYLRERWSELANEALEMDGHSSRIDHRSLEAQGVDRIAQIHLGVGAHKSGERHDLNNSIKEFNKLNEELKSNQKELREVNNEIGKAQREKLALSIIKPTQEPTIAPTVEPVAIVATVAPTQAPEPVIEPLVEPEPTQAPVIPTIPTDQKPMTFEEIESRYRVTKQTKVMLPEELHEAFDSVTAKEAEKKQGLELYAYIAEISDQMNKKGSAEVAMTLAESDLYQDKLPYHRQSLKPYHEAYKKADVATYHDPSEEAKTRKKETRGDYIDAFSSLLASQFQQVHELIKTVFPVIESVIDSIKEAITKDYNRDFWQAIDKQSQDDLSISKAKTKTKGVEF